MEVKRTQLKNWKKQEVYREEEDKRQSCILLRWAVSQKVKNGENMTKARLYVKGCEEVKDFPNDSPCCSGISIRTIFPLIASNQLQFTLINITTR